MTLFRVRTVAGSVYILEAASVLTCRGTTRLVGSDPLRHPRLILISSDVAEVCKLVGTDAAGEWLAWSGEDAASVTA